MENRLGPSRSRTGLVSVAHHDRVPWRGSCRLLCWQATSGGNRSPGGQRAVGAGRGWAQRVRIIAADVWLPGLMNPCVLQSKTVRQQNILWAICLSLRLPEIRRLENWGSIRSGSGSGLQRLVENVTRTLGVSAKVLEISPASCCALAMLHKVPTTFQSREFVETGGL
jgi:hypothetical protein